MVSFYILFYNLMNILIMNDNMFNILTLCDKRYETSR